MDEEFLITEAHLSDLLARFEGGTWPAASFHHAHHLAVAACYLADPEPMDLLRANIRRYNVCQGGENTEDRGYHETLTRFWLVLVQGYAASLPEGLSRLEIARRVVAEFAARRDLFQSYYDFDVLKSREARAAWIPPNRSPADAPRPHVSEASL